MYLTEFGRITPMSLVRQTGNKLGVLLKQDIFKAKSLKAAMKLYDTVYKQVDDILQSLNTAVPDDDTGSENAYTLQNEIEDFFNIISKEDVYRTIYSLDEQRQGNALFRDIGYDEGRKLFPLFMRFFDLFHGDDFTDARKRLNEAAAEPNGEQFILNSLSNMESVTDGASYGRIRSHFGAKYKGLFRAAKASYRRSKHKKKK